MDPKIYLLSDPTFTRWTLDQLTVLSPLYKLAKLVLGEAYISSVV